MNIKLSVAAVALALSAPAFAQEEARTVAVSYADLDLANEKGVAQLQRRVRQAASEACAPVPARGVSELRMFRECQDEAVSQANDDLQTALANKGRSNIRVAQNLQVRAR